MVISRRAVASRRMVVASGAACLLAPFLICGSGPALVAAAQPAERRGQQVGGASSDFNGDSVADLVVRAPGERVAGRETGAVYVVYGSSSGVNPGRRQRLTREDFPAPPETVWPLGWAMASADFDGDRYADLALSSLEPVGASPYAGRVFVIYGSARGLDAARSQVWTQDSPGVLDAAEPDDGFGTALAAADLGKGPYADLAVGVPGEASGGKPSTGAVSVLYGSPTGLTAVGNQLWKQSSPGIEGRAETDDAFGASLVADNFHGRAQADLAVGVPGETLRGRRATGAVNIIAGSPTGLVASGDQVLSAATPGIKGRARAEYRFGRIMTSGHFAGRSYADLAVGTVRESGTAVEVFGPVHVLYGSAKGLTTAGDQVWTGKVKGIPGRAGPKDFGLSIAAGNLGKDRGDKPYDDLAIGVRNGKDPFEVPGGVNVIYGSKRGLSASGSEFWSQSSRGVAGRTEVWDQFGYSLAIADHGRNQAGNRYADLTIGSRGEFLGPRVTLAGRVHVLYSGRAGLSAYRSTVITGSNLGEGCRSDCFLGAATHAAGP